MKLEVPSPTEAGEEEEEAYARRGSVHLEFQHL